MSIFKSSIITSLAVLASRVLGLAREIVFTSLFGASGALDAFLTAFRVPNLLRDLFAEGAMSQSFTSEMSKQRQLHGAQAGWALARKIGTQLVVLMSVIVALGVVFAYPLMQYLYSDGDLSAGELEIRRNLSHMAAVLNQIMWPFIAFTAWAAWAMGALNSCGRFGLPMLSSAAFNVVSVLFGLAWGYLLDPHWGFESLKGFAWGVSLGGLVQFAVQWPQLRAQGLRWHFDFAWKDAAVARVWKMMLPGLFAAGIMQINVFINTGFALELASGSVTVLTTAFRLWQLPVGLFGVATGVVVLPLLARLVAEQKLASVGEQVGLALRQIGFFALPSAIVLGVFGEAIVAFFYQRGRFDATAVGLTGQVLAAYAWGLLGFAGIKVTQPAFIALEKRRVPVVVALLAIVVNYALNWYFVRVLGLNCVWLAVTTSVLTTLNFLIYLVWLKKSVGFLGGKQVWKGLVPMLFAACCMLGLALLLRHYLLLDICQRDFYGKSWRLGISVGAVGIFYLLLCLFTGVKELELLRRRLPLRFRAKG